jgi:hypothetical protein
MKNDLRKTFEDLCKANDMMIESKDRNGLLPVCFIIEDDGKGGENIKIIGFKFTNYQEKIMARNLLMKIILSQNTKGYILMLDAKMTIMGKGSDDNNDEADKLEKIGKVGEVKDVVIRSLCSPKLRIKEIVIYDDETRKIIEKMPILDSEKPEINDYDKYTDEWDLYSQHQDITDEETQKFHKRYSQFKKDNPDKFRGVD